MNLKTRNKLVEKGWMEHEIQKAESILEKKDPHQLHFSKMVFWSSLIVIIFGNLIVSLVLIPFLVFLTENALYMIVSLLALCIGFLYNLLITDLGHLEQKHHIMASIIVPVIAIGNLVVMVSAANQFEVQLGIDNFHNPWKIAIIFAVVLMIPFMVDRVRMIFARNN